MIQVEMSKDIRAYKEKLFGPLSGREALCLAFGLITFLAVKTFVFAGVELVSDASGFILLLCFAPFVIWGWLRISGMYVNEYFKMASKCLFAPKVRHYDNGLKLKRKTIKTKPSKKQELKPFK